MVELIGFADVGCRREDGDSKACAAATGRMELRLIEVGKPATDLEGRSIFFFFLEMLSLGYLLGI